MTDPTPAAGGLTPEEREVLVRTIGQSKQALFLTVEGIIAARTEAAEREVARVAAAVEAAGDLDAAIARVEKSRQTHVEWLDYWRAYDEHDCSGVVCPWEATREEQTAIAGDSDHHRTAISGYDNVLAILTALRAALSSAGTDVLADLLDRERAKAAGEALREAAGAMLSTATAIRDRSHWRATGWANWLRDRAAAVSPEGGDA